MKSITVEVNVEKPLPQVWDAWTLPEHITKWNFASESWHCPRAENDIQSGGKFSWRMEAKDGSMGFDYSGKYHNVIQQQLIELTLDDNRNVKIEFINVGNFIIVRETFEVEDIHTIEQQKSGWQSILNNFKNYTEQGI